MVLPGGHLCGAGAAARLARDLSPYARCSRPCLPPQPSRTSSSPRQSFPPLPPVCSVLCAHAFTSPVLIFSSPVLMHLNPGLMYFSPGLMNFSPGLT
eukprot:2149799-Rhodomonas_salina.7